MFLLLLLLLNVVVTVAFIAIRLAMHSGHFAARKLSDKTPKKKSEKLIFGFIGGTVLLVLVVAWCWSSLDDFLMYTLYIDNNVESADYQDFLPNTWTAAPGYTFGSANGVPGSTGISAMYFGTRGGTYYKEYLEILRDTCNSSLIPDGYFDANKANFPNGRSDWLQIPVFTVIGMNVAETGTNSDKIGPRQYMDVSKYDQASGWTLSNYNSAFIRDQGLTTCDNGFYLNGSLSQNGKVICCPLQFSYNYFDVFVQKPSGWTGSGSKFWPSIMNGYKDPEGQRQGRTTYKDQNGKLDMFYFPDIVAAACEYAHYNFGGSGGNAVLKTINTDAVGLGMGAMHGFGEGWMGSNVKGGIPDGVTQRECAAAAWNQASATYAKGREYAYAHGDDEDVKVNWYTQRTWLGWTATMLLLDGGVVRDSTSLSALKKMADGSSPFSKGALLAYRAMRGSNTSMSDMVNFYQGLSMTTLDNAIYGEHKHYKEFSIYRQISGYSNNGHPLYVKWDSQALYEGGSAYIIGPYAYQKVLGLCGVEASIKDCYSDPTGQLVSKIVVATQVTGTLNIPDVDNSYYYGTRKFVSYVPGSNNLTKQNSCMYWRVISISKGIHFGEDFKAGYDELAAIGSGTVIVRGKDPDGWGNYTQVEVDRPAGDPKIVFLYAHQSEQKVNKGDHVEAGQVIGISGTTGNSTGTHLHLEFWVYNEFDGQTVRSCMSFRSIFQGLYTPATGPRVRRIDSGSKMNKEACIVYSGVGENLGLLSTITDKDYPANAKSEPVETAGLNYFMNAALQSYAMKMGVRGTTATPSGSAATSQQIQTIITAARSKIGYKYSNKNDENNGYDCSGLVAYAFRQAGLKCPAPASKQRYNTAQIKISDVQPGDLFFCHEGSISYLPKTQREEGHAHHVGLVTGVSDHTPSGIMCIDSNKWANSQGVYVRDGPKEESLASQYGSGLQESSDGMYFYTTDRDGVMHYYTFGRFIKEF